MDELKAVINNL